jgi:hypothetical protein
MKRIGYWMESLLEENLPLPQELVGMMSDSVRDAVCAYLRGGRRFEVYLGFSWCRFHCAADDREMGCREFTDGEWVWPEGLVHYVSVHGVLLPEEFIARATSGGMVGGADGSTTASLDFWIEWAGQRRSSTTRHRLADALAAARAAEPAFVQSLIEEVLTCETEGSEPCIFAGCSRRALAGRRNCARHTFNDEDLKWQAAHLYTLPAQI